MAISFALSLEAAVPPAVLSFNQEACFVWSMHQFTDFTTIG